MWLRLMGYLILDWESCTLFSVVTLNSLFMHRSDEHGSMAFCCRKENSKQHIAMIVLEGGYEVGKSVLRKGRERKGKKR